MGSNPTLSASHSAPTTLARVNHTRFAPRPGHRDIVATSAVCYDRKAMADIKHWVAFSLIPKLGTVRFRLLEDHFRSLDVAWTAGQSEIRAAGLDEKTASAIVTQRDSISPDGEMEKLLKAGVQALTWNDASYPPRLKEIHDPPPVLYVRGEILPEDERSVAVVGTRKATAYGREAAGTLARDLAGSGVTIVSGLARGIDSIAHRAALEGEGRTIAVFGCGLDVIYPPEHRRLASDILERGVLVSEWPLGTRPKSTHFPLRNRIISGMTLGTLVVEAPMGSGALWTVRHALEQNREVFCVPGSIFSPVSKGTNALIQDGAKLVMSHTDILEELNLTVVSHQIEMREMLHPADDNESVVLDHLSHDPVHIDEIRRRSGLPIAVVSSTLSMMELKGMIRQVGGMNYTRIREAVAGYGN